MDRPTAVDVLGLTSGVAAISAGGDHTCALTTAGGVKCWGRNGRGQLGDGTTTDRLTPVDVTGLTSGIAAISASSSHTCALTTGGGVKCWGYNDFGQLGDGTVAQRLTAVDVTGLTSGVAAISAGDSHTCALTMAGGVKCWGYNGYGTLGDGTTMHRATAVSVTGLTSGVAAISAGREHTCALTTGGGMQCWGRNDYGQLGDGTMTPRLTAVDVTGLTSDVAVISAGDLLTCALTTGGGVKCWGGAFSGSVGDGTVVAQRLTAVDVMGLTSGVAAISAGPGHSCALTTAGGVKCWGSNGNGRLGDGTIAPRLTAVDVTGLASGVAAISAGDFHTCALTIGGGVKCWGGPFSGSVGDGTLTQRLTAVDVAGLASGVAAISADGLHTCALTTGGGVKCWGNNHYGQLGDGTMTDPTTAVDGTGLTSSVAAISAGSYYTCALTTGGGVKCWGNNYSGQLGDGTIAPRLTAVDVTGLASGVAAVSAGGAHTCALTTGGGVKCWGSNVEGQLGDGTTTDRLTAADVMGLASGFAAISAGGEHSCALTTGGGVKCWGRNDYGQLGDGTFEQRLTAVDVTGLTSGVAAISAGFNFSCALTTAGGMKCWGGNGYGQLGDGTFEQRLTAVDVVGLTSGVTAISADGSHTCAVTTGGGAKCWGANFFGELGNGEAEVALSPITAAGFGPVCGNGTIEPGEQCDDANTSSGDCCSSTCQFEAGPQPGCTDSDLCTSDACDGAGSCTHTALPDTDGDAVCDQQDACTNVGGGQDFVTKPKSTLVLTKVNTDTTPANEKLVLKGSFNLPANVSFADLDPRTHGARVVVRTALGADVLDVVLPPETYAGKGTRGWRTNASRSFWQYLDKTGAPVNGVTALKATDRSKGAAGGLIALTVTGKDGTYTVATGDVPLAAIVVLGNQTDAIAGMCGESAYADGDCSFNASATSVKCQR